MPPKSLRVPSRRRCNFAFIFCCALLFSAVQSHTRAAQSQDSSRLSAALRLPDSLIETSQAERQASTPLALWREVEPLAAPKNESALIAALTRNRHAARSLYNELLFDAVDSRLYNNPPISPDADHIRTLLARIDAEAAVLETKLAEWSKEHKAGVGFVKTTDGLEQLLYLYIAAEPKNGEKQETREGVQPLTPRQLTESALKIAEATGNELAAASIYGNLASYAHRDKRLPDAAPLIERAAAIWQRWQHPAGLLASEFLRAEDYALAEYWRDAAQAYRRAYELTKTRPALRRYRLMVLPQLATSLRNAGDKEGTRRTFELAVEEAREQLATEEDHTKHLAAAQNLVSLEVQLGDALNALDRYAEAAEWFARADKLDEENYRIQLVQTEEQLTSVTANLQAKIDKSPDEATRKIFIQSRETVFNALTSILDGLALKRNDNAARARIAERQLLRARETNNTFDIANSLDAVAEAYRRAGDFDKARATAAESLKLRQADPRRRNLYKTVDILAGIAYDADDNDAAIARYREVIELAKPGALPTLFDLNAEPRADIRPILARGNATDRIARVMNSLFARHWIANILMGKGNYREADQELTILAESIPQMYVAGAPDEVELTRWLSEMKAKPDVSPNPRLTQIKIANIVEHRRQIGFEPSSDETERLNTAELFATGLREAAAIGRANLLNAQYDLEGATKAYEEAIRLASNFSGGYFPITGMYVAIARIETERGNYAKAEAALMPALEKYKRNRDAAGIANIIAQQSTLRRKQGQFNEARRLAEEALNIGGEINSRSLIAPLARTLGRAELETGGDALLAAERHLRQSLKTWRELGERATIAYTLGDLGYALERQGRETDALAAYEEAVKLVESLTGALSQGVSADTFNSSRSSRDLYDRLIKLLIKRGRATDALGYLERAKSKSLVDALAGANVNARNPALNNLLDRVRASSDAVRIAETALTSELAKPAAQRDNTKIADAQSKLSAAQKEYLSAAQAIERANPSYASMVAVNPTNLAEIQKQLPAKTLLLEYFPSDKELYIFVVTRDAAPTIRTISITREALANLVMQYRDALSSADEPSVLERSARGSLWKDDGQADFKTDVLPLKEATVKLYDALIAPVQTAVDEADTLLIVPAAELYYLPIHALGRAKSDGSINFLIEQKRFAYFASADLLNVVNATAATTGKLSGKADSVGLLALGNPDGSLPAATDEVAALSRLFTKSSVYTGKDATVARVTQPAATRTPFLHFATHGVIDSRDPKETYLLLAGTPNRLSVKDIVEDKYKLSLDGTRLVTLSACQTNIGGYDPSAVYSSLSRAFSKAGAPTVIASLWSVNDASTRDTMTLFYKELAAGVSKAEAMRRAQLGVMRDPRFAHPYYWAPFVVLGDWR